ncbi:GTP-binding protein [Pseudomonas stutzeri]|uniref:YdcH family protein n=1 Tax=Stutzerimonas stutzeri TaxID=316 RepID=UPI00210F16D7|nr:GTP-binding protein [Stutzerimonas stutzeri]MCQ4309750.1 GTP-binding protein [Stutzerimonas stutzeri]
MHVEHHALIKDFPEKREQLQKLRMENPVFARKTEEYEALDKRISSAANLDDASLEALKQERETLKGDIARDLKRASGSCCGGCCG